MISVMVVVGVEMFFATKGAGHSHSSEFTSGESGERHAHVHKSNGHVRPQQERSESFRRFKQGHIGLGRTSEEVALEDASDWPAGTNGHATVSQSKDQKDTSAEEDDSDLDLDEMDIMDPQTDSSRFLVNHGERDSGDGSKINENGDRNRQASGSSLSEHQQQQKMLLQCMLLEAGILFHSVFIGMALSVATGTSFIVLLVAISFHQTFEGLALGSRIAAITAFPKGSPKPWLMALAYGTTTPMGQAIGLLIHNLYDPYSQVGLLMVGVMNAISSGLLLFAGLVELLAEDFLSDHSYETLKGQKRLQACVSVLAGSFLMALVGAWA